MKKVIYLAILAVAFGCAKSQTEQTITINIGGVRTGAISKGATDILSATAPSALPTLTLTSDDGEHTYEVAPGTPLSVRLGTYSVRGEYVTDASKSIPSFGFAYAEPRYRVSSSIVVAEGTTEYEVDAIYDCWALIIDYTTTEKYSATKSSDTDYTDVACFTRVGDYGIAYIWKGGASAKNKCKILATPLDTETYDATAYTISWNGTEGIVVQNGRWYLFSAGEAERESGDFGVNLPEWEAGN